MYSLTHLAAAAPGTLPSFLQGSIGPVRSAAILFVLAAIVVNAVKAAMGGGHFIARTLPVLGLAGALWQITADPASILTLLSGWVGGAITGVLSWLKTLV